MNRVLLTGMIVMLTLISCSDKKTKDEPTPQVKSLAEAPDPVAMKLESLKKAEPTDLGAMSALFPEELDGIKRSTVSMNSDWGYGMAQADYEKKGKNSFHLIMYDCSGEAGSNLYKKSFLAYVDKPSETAEGYVKTIDFKGNKAIERYETLSNITTISFLGNDKILVVLSGKKIQSDSLRVAAEKINVKAS